MALVKKKTRRKIKRKAVGVTSDILSAPARLKSSRSIKRDNKELAIIKRARTKSPRRNPNGSVALWPDLQDLLNEGEAKKTKEEIKKRRAKAKTKAKKKADAKKKRAAREKALTKKMKGGFRP
jgi:5-methylcytosine-specific restriction endonuclease McrA